MKVAKPSTGARSQPTSWQSRSITFWCNHLINTLIIFWCPTYLLLKFSEAVTTPWLRRCTLNMVCQVGEDMSRFIGCLATLSTEMLRSTVKVLGVNNSVVEQWSVDYKSETLSDDAKQDKKERDDKDALTRYHKASFETWQSEVTHMVTFSLLILSVHLN